MSMNQMDYERTKLIADRFASFAEECDSVNKAIESSVQSLHSVSFVGLAGNRQLEKYMSVLEPNIHSLADSYREISNDILAAIKDRRAAHGEEPS